jgi:hypothetical protein
MAEDARLIVKQGKTDGGQKDLKTHVARFNPEQSLPSCAKYFS